MTIQHELVQQLAKDYQVLAIKQDESDEDKGMGIGQGLDDVFHMYEEMKRIAGTAITALHALTRSEGNEEEKV